MFNHIGLSQQGWLLPGHLSGPHLGTAQVEDVWGRSQQGELDLQSALSGVAGPAQLPGGTESAWVGWRLPILCLCPLAQWLWVQGTHPGAQL